jgi:adenine-specific DNA glycosylase
MLQKVNLSNFSQKILFWNKKSNRRVMPWKGEKDPYKIWLSEIILQQTRVEQLITIVSSQNILPLKV